MTDPKIVQAAAEAIYGYEKTWGTRRPGPDEIDGLVAKAVVAAIEPMIRDEILQPVTDAIREVDGQQLRYPEEVATWVHTVSKTEAEIRADQDRKTREQAAAAIEADLVRTDRAPANAFALGQEYAARLVRKGKGR